MNTAIRVENPSVHIAVNKNRVKYYPEGYYLSNKQEFQLELHNPLSEIILAEISVNNVKIGGSGLVLRPGERVFLERYIDSNNKFIFETYEVGNTETNKNAIKNNGNVEVKFFKQLQINYVPTTWTTTNNPGYIPYTYTIPEYNINTFGTTSTGTSTNYCGVSATSLTSGTSIYNTTNSRGILTGMVGKGESSDQKFENVNYNFNIYAFYTAYIKLLPIENKVYSTNDIKVKRYCVECGAVVKPTFKFCASCGTKV